MPSTGTIEIDGKTYTWTSPTFADLEHFESMVGKISDADVLNSVKGRVWLAWLCLKRNHPDLTPKLIGDWSAVHWLDLWTMITDALPLWGGAKADETKAAASSERSTPFSSDSPTGLPAELGASA